MRASRLLTVALASMAATTAFILACGKGPGSASAQACTAWEVSVLNLSAGDTNCGGIEPAYPATCRAGSGWEPFAAGDSSHVMLRRCAQ
jgi:hypothetical protein